MPKRKTMRVTYQGPPRIIDGKQVDTGDTIDVTANAAKDHPNLYQPVEKPTRTKGK